MQAMIYRRYGGPEVLRLEAVAEPTPEPNDVLVHVHAASLNAADTYLLSGQPASGPGHPRGRTRTRQTRPTRTQRDPRRPCRLAETA